jgi:hypothetical protein
MKIQCHTNLDLHFNEQWPEKMPCRPINGDIITSSTGLELEVVRVAFSGGLTEHQPLYCKVELHLPPYRFANISTFEEWYRNRR